MTVAKQLREKLVARREAICSLSDLALFMRGDPVWWHPSAHWWSLYCGRLSENRRAAHDSHGHRDLQATVEALALLDALARIDVEAFAEEVDAIRAECGRPASRDGPVPQEIVLGVTCVVNSVEDLEPIAKCMYAATPSSAFLNDVAWLTKQTDVSGEFQGILPVRVRLCIRSPRQLTKLLQHILHLVDKQQNQPKSVTEREKEPLAVARFEIVEVAMHSDAFGPYFINADDLPILEQLQERGVYIPILPELRGDDGPSPALTKSLHHLLMPHEPLQLSIPRIEHVCLSNGIPQHLIAPLLSALQSSKTVKTVELSVFQDQEDVDDDEHHAQGYIHIREDRQRALTWLVRWTAYALLSRHANHSIETVIVRDGFLTDEIINIFRRVLQESNPLASVFENVAENEKWITASQFHLEPPDSQSPNTTNPVVFATQEALIVHAVERSICAGSLWWKILLPGYGLAWVPPMDTTAIVGSFPSKRAAPLQIEFDYLSRRNIDVAHDLIRLTRLSIGGVSIEAFDINEENFEPDDDCYDMTYFVQEMLRICPRFERVKLPSNTTIERLGIFVEAATNLNLKLRVLDLECVFESDETDLIEFFDVLSDAMHPLSKDLEELHLQIDQFHSDLRASWDNMLQKNRRLHTISISVSGGSTCDYTERNVAVRVGSLDMASKLAFLSVFQHPKYISGSLDASLISQVFEYAAQHRVRDVSVERT